ncbi:MAG: TetR family transcriptional regulator [Pararhodobacter sp.]
MPIHSDLTSPDTPAAALFDRTSARGRLLQTAARHFRAKGYGNTTVRDIAADLGIQSGSLFHHFRSKEDILFAVMDTVIDAMNDDLARAIGTAPDLTGQVRALIAVELNYLHGPASDATAVLFHEWRALPAERRQVLIAGRDAYFALWQKVLAEAHAKGLSPVEPDILRQLLHGALAWTSFWYKPDGPLNPDALTDQALALALGRHGPQPPLPAE